MADRYLSFTGTAPGRFLTRRLGLPQPAPLRRDAFDGGLLHLTAGKSDLGLAPVLARTGLAADDDGRPAAVVLDATGVRDVDALAEVHAALHPVVRSVAASGRVVVLGAPLDAADHHQAAVQQALEGFTRSLGKEIGRGRTVNLVRLTDAAPAESTLRFLLSPASAYVSGQVIEVGTSGAGVEPDDWDLPLAGRTALVTGAARGIGAAVAETLA
ncbi:short chain dehydrogenase, partial [Streptomyces sp. SID6013]|nr:short chain dehydrogenase [Streptomyces sp. SID6013]